MPDRQIHVMLLDDDSRVLRSLARQLEEMDLAVATTVSAAEALAILNCHQVDVIVCDNEMPGTSGVQFLAKIRTEFPSMQRIMLTGSILEHNVQLAINELGVAAVLPKPCEAAVVANVIRTAVQQHAAC